MLLNGFKATGNFAHEAEVAYLKNLKFSDSIIYFVNELRYYRNSIIYYGKLVDVEYAKKVFKFTSKIYLRLSKIVKS